MCTNRVEVSVPRGWDYKTVMYRCGNTGIDGDMILCSKCEPDRKGRQADIDADDAWARSAGWGEF